MTKLLTIIPFIFFALLFAACKKELPGSANDYKALGSSAHPLLSPAVYRSLRIEVSYMPGYEPQQAALNNLVTFLERYLNKPGGIQIISHSIAASGKQSLTLNDVVNIERKSRVNFSEGNTAAVHILLADADYADPDNLAISYWNTSICLFGKTINAKLSGISAAGKANVYTTLLRHEFGHLLGLVGQGSPQQVVHRDNDHGAHCSNRQCLMYYQVETNTPTVNLPELDDHCINDLKANGGR